MLNLLEEIQKEYHFTRAKLEPIRENENQTFKLTCKEGRFLVRIHEAKEGFDISILNGDMNQEDRISAELTLLGYLDNFQKPIKNIFGKRFSLIGNHIVSVLTWLNGDILKFEDLNPQIAFDCGKMCGKLHQRLELIKINNCLRYDSALINRLISELEKGIEEKRLPEKDGATIRNTLVRIKKYLDDNDSKMILVHSDLGLSNIIKGDELTPIDFSLFGYCVREMDVASLIGAFNGKYEEEIIRGYEEVNGNKVDRELLFACLCLQVLLFLIIQNKRYYEEEWYFSWVHKKCVELFSKLQ